MTDSSQSDYGAASPPASAALPQASGEGSEAASHERFGRTELAVVLSYYELGYISRIKPFRRGSRRSPKVRLTAESGEYLLKRRAPTNNDPYRVAHAHELQLHLATHGYPVAELIGTRRDNNSMLRLDDHTYELFRYMSGDRYDLTKRATVEAGRQLGRLHFLLRDFTSNYDPPDGSFHDANVRLGLKQIPEAVAAVDQTVDLDALAQCCQRLQEQYETAAERVNALGFKQWPRRPIHGDWHPGNVLYRGSRVLAVLDFDSARREPRMAELANAVLQFSIRMGEVVRPGEWPAGFSGRRAKSMVTGYEDGSQEPLSPEERQALPWLMMEAFIIESVVPIARTGRFARIPGAAFLSMVDEKVRWLVHRADILVEHIDS